MSRRGQAMRKGPPGEHVPERSRMGWVAGITALPWVGCAAVLRSGTVSSRECVYGAGTEQDQQEPDGCGRRRVLRLECNHICAEEKMTREELLAKLREMREGQGPGQYRDVEADHFVADGLLLEYIGDEEVTDAFDSIEKWYS